MMNKVSTNCGLMSTVMALWTCNVEKIKLAIQQFACGKSFRNLNINEIVFLFKKTIKNILSNYIPHETILCDDGDPIWITTKIKQLVQETSNICQSYILSNKNPPIFYKVKYFQNKLKLLTEIISSDLKKTDEKFYCGIGHIYWRNF